MISDVLGVKQPRPWKSKQTPVVCAAPDQIVGLEIETEGCTLTDEQYATRISKLWEVKTDGSLRGRAYEFISKPAEIKILIPELADFYVKTGFREENYSDRCSIHVHTNISDMTVTQVAALCLVYSVVEELLFEFVNHYNVTDPRGKYRDTNIYCVPWSQCRMNHNMVQTMFADVNYAFKRWQKYTALNILPARTLGTFEWRHMHGTANMDKLTKWLNLIGSIMDYCKKNEFDAIVKLIKELNDTSAYRQFFGSVLGDYLPYNDTYAKAIEQGIVNAKYAIIGLKDNKPVDRVTHPPEPEDPFAQLRARVAGREGLGNLFADELNLANWAQDEAAPAAVGQQAGLPPDPIGFHFNNIGAEAAPQRPEVPRRPARPVAERLRGIDEEIRAGVQQAIDLELEYPLSRGLLTARGGHHDWAVKSADNVYVLRDGRVFFQDQVIQWLEAHVNVMGTQAAMWSVADAGFNPHTFLEQEAI